METFITCKLASLAKTEMQQCPKKLHHHSHTVVIVHWSMNLVTAALCDMRRRPASTSCRYSTIKYRSEMHYCTLQALEKREEVSMHVVVLDKRDEIVAALDLRSPNELA